MATTSTLVGMTRDGRAIHRHVEAGAANTQLAVTFNPAGPCRILLVTARYSAAPTQAGVTAVLDSGAGAEYDTTLNTGSANAQNTVYSPNYRPVLSGDDALVVTAPAGGVGITAAVAIYTEGL